MIKNLERNKKLWILAGSLSFIFLVVSVLNFSKLEVGEKIYYGK